MMMSTYELCIVTTIDYCQVLSRRTTIIYNLWWTQQHGELLATYSSCIILYILYCWLFVPNKSNKVRSFLLHITNSKDNLGEPKRDKIFRKSKLKRTWLVQMFFLFFSPIRPYCSVLSYQAVVMSYVLNKSTGSSSPMFRETTSTSFYVAVHLVRLLFLL